MNQKIALKTIGSQEWETPQRLFDKLDREFHFTLDPCATHINAKCGSFFTKEDDGLSLDWFGSVFVNPPFKQVAKWVQKAYKEVSKGNAKIAVMLVAARTDTRWFHRYVLPFAKIRFLKGRLKYSNVDNPCPFPVMIVIFEYGKLTKFLLESFTINEGKVKKQ